MDATEAADVIREIKEDRAEHEAQEQFRSRTALVIAVLAMLLAISSLGAGNVSEELVHANIRASDMWAFYQAKNIRQTTTRLAADALDAELRLRGVGMSDADRRRLQERLDGYQRTVARYEDEPDPGAPGDSLRGEGKRQLAAQARYWEAVRERAHAQGASFDIAGVLFQIAIVLGSVAIIATSRPVLLLSVVLGALATLLTVNGFLLLARLPF